MKELIKDIGRTFLGKNVRLVLFKSIPKFQLTNTYFLVRNNEIQNLIKIDEKFLIRKVTSRDEDLLKEVYGDDHEFRTSILPRLRSTAWQGLAVLDPTKDKFAYVSWIIRENTPFINEFGIVLSKHQYFLRHGFCVTEYRHQGIHTRMEQERINYCIRNGATEIYIQIADKNQKGKASVHNNGFRFIQKNMIIRIPLLGIYREFKSFLRTPFKKVL